MDCAECVQQWPVWIGKERKITRNLDTGHVIFHPATGMMRLEEFLQTPEEFKREDD